MFDHYNSKLFAKMEMLGQRMDHNMRQLNTAQRTYANGVVQEMARGMQANLTTQEPWSHQKEKSENCTTYETCSTKRSAPLRNRGLTKKRNE